MRENEAGVSGNSKFITRVDIHGSVKETQTFDCDLWPGEITVTSQADLLHSTKTVNNIRHDGIEKVLTVSLVNGISFHFVIFYFRINHIILKQWCRT